MPLRHLHILTAALRPSALILDYKYIQLTVELARLYFQKETRNKAKRSSFFLLWEKKYISLVRAALLTGGVEWWVNFRRQSFVNLYKGECAA